MWKLRAQKFSSLTTISYPFTLSFLWSNPPVSTRLPGSPLLPFLSKHSHLSFPTGLDILHCQSLALWPYQHPQYPPALVFPPEYQTFVFALQYQSPCWKESYNCVWEGDCKLIFFHFSRTTDKGWSSFTQPRESPPSSTVPTHHFTLRWLLLTFSSLPKLTTQLLLPQSC